MFRCSKNPKKRTEKLKRGKKLIAEIFEDFWTKTSNFFAILILMIWEKKFSNLWQAMNPLRDVDFYLSISRNRAWRSKKVKKHIKNSNFHPLHSHHWKNILLCKFMSVRNNLNINLIHPRTHCGEMCMLLKLMTTICWWHPTWWVDSSTLFTVIKRNHKINAFKLLRSHFKWRTTDATQRWNLIFPHFFPPSHWSEMKVICLLFFALIKIFSSCCLCARENFLWCKHSFLCK